jgi:hypothetical protein
MPMENEAGGSGRQLGRASQWIHGIFLRFAAAGLVPARWFLSDLPSAEERSAKCGRLKIEVVSHCWNYSHLLAYQLSSLVQQPPADVDITMTVFFCSEDVGTVKLLDRFGAINVPGITWNWRSISREHLFRRAIGRNLAARETDADWVWFTDCDLIFKDGCLDALGQVLQGRRDALVFPREERCTSLLASSDPMLQADDGPSPIVEIDVAEFTVRVREKATGPLQITHGDVARACGYCDSIRLYQQPSEVWRKTYEDTAFRWLIRTQGVPIDLPGVYRIRHVEKGRYTGSSASTSVRSLIRRFTSWWAERGMD